MLEGCLQADTGPWQDLQEKKVMTVGIARIAEIFLKQNRANKYSPVKGKCKRNKLLKIEEH